MMYKTKYQLGGVQMLCAGIVEPYQKYKLNFSPLTFTSDPDMRCRSSTDSERASSKTGTGIPASIPGQAGSLARSRSAQSLRLQDRASHDDKMNILVQMFWICLAVLESDYEHEFLLGLRLLERVLAKLPLDRPDVREKVEKLQASLQIRKFQSKSVSKRLIILR